MKTTNRILSLALAAAVSLSMFVPASAASPTFTDVPTTHWAYAYVEKAASAGYVSGIGDNKYNPSGTVTYAEFCTTTVRAFAQSVIDMFDSWCTWTGTDPDEFCEHWYDLYMWSALHSLSMLSGTKADTLEQKVAPEIAESTINRYEMAQIMYNIMMNGGVEHMGGTVPTDAEISAAKSKIADWSSVPSNYRDAVAACYAAGLLSGVDSKGTFSGTSTMDRAQAATVMCNLCNLDVNGSGNGNESSNQGNGTQTGSAVGQKDANGYTTAASVNSVKNRNKSDAYPTKGGASFFAASADMIQLGKEGKIDYDGIIANAQKVSVNGYYTGSTVDAGDSVLVYDFLDMVNEARKAEGLNELEWVQSDAAEEYTLVRAMDLTKSFSHFGQHTGFSQEVIAWGAGDAQSMFDSWMNSEGHRDTLMSEGTWKYMCAAKNGARWIICIFRDFEIDNLERFSIDYDI